jgi:hypothetical protein
MLYPVELRGRGNKLIFALTFANDAGLALAQTAEAAVAT